MTYETVDSYAANTNHANAGRYYYLNFIGSQADGFYKDDQMPYTITRRDIINIQRN